MIVSGTSPGGVDEIGAGVLYLLSAVGLFLVAPVVAISAALLAIWDRWSPPA